MEANIYYKESKEQVAGRAIKHIFNRLSIGVIPNELIDLVYKGLNYEKDIQEAANMGFVEGKNVYKSHQ
jgi:hypothetical protein